MPPNKYTMAEQYIYICGIKRDIYLYRRHGRATPYWHVIEWMDGSCGIISRESMGAHHLFVTLSLV